MLLNKASPVFFLTVLLIMCAVSARAATAEGSELQAPTVETAMLAVEVSNPVAQGAPADVLNLCNFAAAPALRNDDGGVVGNTIKLGGITVQLNAENQYEYSNLKTDAQPGSSALKSEPFKFHIGTELKSMAHYSGNLSGNAKNVSSGGLDGRISPYFAS